MTACHQLEHPNIELLNCWHVKDQPFLLISGMDPYPIIQNVCGTHGECCRLWISDNPTICYTLRGNVFSHVVYPKNCKHDDCCDAVLYSIHGQPQKWHTWHVHVMSLQSPGWIVPFKSPMNQTVEPINTLSGTRLFIVTCIPYYNNLAHIKH